MSSALAEEVVVVLVAVVQQRLCVVAVAVEHPGSSPAVGSLHL